MDETVDTFEIARKSVGSDKAFKDISTREN
jgi:hypothetical protein